MKTVTLDMAQKPAKNLQKAAAEALAPQQPADGAAAGAQPMSITLGG